MPRRYHLGINWGATGVDLFFVLSGFLITGILLACRRPLEDGLQSVGFTARRFYARRFLRIFPLYYAVLALASVALTLEPAILASLWTYTFNLVGAWKGALSGRLISHFWSLAVEEQFYLVWPWVILLVPRRALVPLVCATIAVGPLSRWILFRSGAPFDAMRMVTTCSRPGRCSRSSRSAPGSRPCCAGGSRARRASWGPRSSCGGSRSRCAARRASARRPWMSSSSTRAGRSSPGSCWPRRAASR